MSNLQGGRDLGGISPGPGGGAVDQIRPVERREIHAALQMILGVGGRPAAEEHVIDFLRFAVYRGIDLNNTWVATSDGALVWAVLPVISPGRTMLLFSPSHVPGTGQDTRLAQLVEHAIARFRQRGIDLVQVLLDPTDESVTRLYRDACGFTPLAELIYLDRDVHRAPAVVLPPGYWWETYSPASHDAFARAISASYVGSLDCPRLNGRRAIEDAIAGHKAAGEFDPKLWFLLRGPGRSGVGAGGTAGVAGASGVPSAGGAGGAGGAAGAGRAAEEAGVVLLSRSTRSESVELVYLGLAPGHRGRQLGDALMRHALATVASIGSRRLSLAVDAGNAPALRLYRRHGLTRLCSRLALLRDLRERGEAPQH